MGMPSNNFIKYQYDRISSADLNLRPTGIWLESELLDAAQAASIIEQAQQEAEQIIFAAQEESARRVAQAVAEAEAEAFERINGLVQGLEHIQRELLAQAEPQMIAVIKTAIERLVAEAPDISRIQSLIQEIFLHTERAKFVRLSVPQGMKEVVYRSLDNAWVKRMAEAFELVENANLIDTVKMETDRFSVSSSTTLALQTLFKVIDAHLIEVKHTAENESSNLPNDEVD